MNDYKFAQYPSNSSVASTVTLLVSVWFLVAAGAILSDPVSPYTHRARPQPVLAQAAAVPLGRPAPVEIVPEARLTITVEASRSSTLQKRA